MLIDTMNIVIYTNKVIFLVEYKLTTMPTSLFKDNAMCKTAKAQLAMLYKCFRATI